MRSSCCLSMNPPLPSTFEHLNHFYETWYVYHGNWTNLNGVLEKPLPPVSVSVCVAHLSLLGNGSVNTFQWQQIQATIEELLDVSFSMRSVLSKESLWVCLCIPLPLLGNNSVKTFQRKRWIVGGVVLYALRVVTKESRRLILPTLTTISVCQTTHGRISGWWMNTELKEHDRGLIAVLS
jgi:hypothetical protein